MKSCNVTTCNSRVCYVTLILRWNVTLAPACTSNLINSRREKDYLEGDGIERASPLNKMNLRFTREWRARYFSDSGPPHSLIVSINFRAYSPEIYNSEEWRGRRTRGRDIFFLNSFAGDYSSAITALTKHETAQNP